MTVKLKEWHAMGNLGHWTEWHRDFYTLREAMDECKPTVRYNGYAIFLRNGDTWLMTYNKSGNKPFTVMPYKPLP